MSGAAAALELLGIRKRFGSAQALRGADFTLAPGEIHALLGENGAGKTTLMHVAYGLVQPDAGEVRVGGAPRRVPSPRVARILRIGMVHQHFTSIPALTVAENVALAAGWPVAPAALSRRVRALSERLGLPMDPDERTSRLTVALRQRLEIVKALAGDARVLLLDEPTAVLAPAEVQELFRVVRRFAGDGGATVLITHKLDEALAAADRVTVLRRGAVVLTGPTASFDRGQLAEAMIGESPGAASPLAAAEGGADDRAAPAVSGDVGEGKTGPVRVLARDIDVARESGHGIAVRQASLEVRGGEIVGIAAVEGNGQRELLRALAGRLPVLRGRLTVTGSVGFIPEDRTTEGLIPELSLTENFVLGSTPADPWINGRRVDWAAARARTADLLEQFGVTAPGPDTPAAALSGGNQQRVVVARELARRPAVLVAENPTRGLDLRATQAIHARLRRVAAEGAAVLVHASDLDEVIELATRLVIVRRGTLVEAPAGAARADIGALMLGTASPG